jgi:hypothetical protein
LALFLVCNVCSTRRCCLMVCVCDMTRSFSSHTHIIYGVATVSWLLTIISLFCRI